MATLQNADPDCLLLPKDIANANHAQRREELTTKTLTEALFEKLNSSDFFFKYEIDSDNQLRYLFWAHTKPSEWYLPSL